MPARAKLWWPGLFAAALLSGLVACGTVTRSARGQAGADLVVRDFCRSFGRQKGLVFVSLFGDSARFDLEGLSVSFVGRDGLARLADYGAAVHSRLAVRDIEERQDTVRRRLEESNDWLGPLGVKHASYDGRFRVSGTRILEAQISLTPESRDELGGRLASFVTWLLNEDPKALQRLLPGGRPAYDANVVPELVARLRQWQSRAR